MNWLNENKALWNKKVDIHFNSKFYDVETFRSTKNSLNEIELSELGDVSGKSLLHLQCHFGMDTISWAAKGAKVLGVDFSDEAILKANQLSEETGIKADFICSDVYSLDQILNEKFDIVFTSYGTIGWLPDLDKWANIISHFLKPDGSFYIADFHPYVWMSQSGPDLSVRYSYFNTDVIIDELEGTYADQNSDIKMKEYGWNHPLSEIINSLIKAGLQIKNFNEFDYSPYNVFPNMTERENGKWIFEAYPNMIPLVYSLTAGLASRYQLPDFNLFK